MSLEDTVVFSCLLRNRGQMRRCLLEPNAYFCSVCMTIACMLLQNNFFFIPSQAAFTRLMQQEGMVFI